MKKIIKELELNLRCEMVARNMSPDIIRKVSEIVLDTLKNTSKIEIGRVYYYKGTEDDPSNGDLVTVILNFNQEEVENQLGYTKEAKDKKYQFFLVRDKEGCYFEVNQNNLSEFLPSSKK